LLLPRPISSSLFSSPHTPTTHFYPLSLHDALPISILFHLQSLLLAHDYLSLSSLLLLSESSLRKSFHPRYTLQYPSSLLLLAVPHLLKSLVHLLQKLVA